LYETVHSPRISVKWLGHSCFMIRAEIWISKVPQPLVDRAIRLWKQGERSEGEDTVEYDDRDACSA